MPETLYEGLRGGFLGLTAEEAIEKQHDVNLYSHHRIRLIDARIMWDMQGHICACCGAPGPDVYTPNRDWVIDHDHTCCPSSVRRECGGSCTRGIICVDCNSVMRVHIEKLGVYESIGIYLGLLENPPKQNKTQNF